MWSHHIKPKTCTEFVILLPVNLFTILSFSGTSTRHESFREPKLVYVGHFLHGLDQTVWDESHPGQIVHPSRSSPVVTGPFPLLVCHLYVFCPFSPRLRVGSFHLFLWTLHSSMNVIQTNEGMKRKLRQRLNPLALSYHCLLSGRPRGIVALDQYCWLIISSKTWPQFLMSASVLLLLFGSKSLFGNIILIPIDGDRGSHSRESMNLESEKPRFNF